MNQSLLNLLSTSFAIATLAGPVLLFTCSVSFVEHFLQGLPNMTNCTLLALIVFAYGLSVLNCVEAYGSH